MVDSKWHGGKGSKTRPTDTTKYHNNYDAIFGKKNKEYEILKSQSVTSS